MAKKITAPKTHKPSGGRPLEHLAYLNRYEMDYLMSLNGGAMSRGPRGLPSFAEETVGPGGGGGGGGGGQSGGPSSSGGPGGQSSGSTAPAAGSTQPQSSTLNRDDVMMVDALGNAYDYNGNRVSAAPSQNPSNSFASPNFPSTSNLDKSIADAAKISGAMSTVANTPAIKADGVTGFTSRPPSSAVAPSVSTTPSKAPVSTTASGIRSLNVGPVGTEVKTGSAPKVSAAPSAKIGMSAPQGFYDGITSDQVKALADRQRQAERESLGLVGKSAKDPRGTLNTPANVGPSAAQEMSYTEALKRAGMSAVNALTNPIGTGANQAVGMLGGALDQIKGTMDSIYAANDPRTASMPGAQEEAVKNAFDTALNYGILGLGVSGVSGGVPENSVGAFVSPKVSLAPELRRAYQKAEEMFGRFSGSKLSPEQMASLERDVFNTTKQMVGSDVSGIQRMRGNLAVEIADPYSLKVSSVGAPTKYKDVFEAGPVQHYVPQVREVTVVSDPRGLKSNPPQMGYYSSSSVNDPYTGLSGIMRSYKDQLLGRSGEIPGPGISINSLDPAVLGRIEKGATPERLAAHEIGGHYMSDISGNLYSEQKPVGPDLYANELQKMSPSLSKEEAMRMAEEIYFNHMEEQAARKMENRAGLPGSFIREYENRFTNFSPSELERAIESKKKRDARGVTRALRERFGDW